MPEKTSEELMADIAQRAAALVREELRPAADAPLFTQEQEARFQEIVNGVLTGLSDDHAFVRKMRFGSPDEALIGSKFGRWGLGVEDVEFLHELMTARRETGQGRGPSEELESTFQAVSDAYYLPADEVRRIDRQAIDDLYPRVPKNRALDLHNRIKRAEAYRAMDTQEAGYGLELVGAQYVGNLWEVARPASRVFGLLPDFEMTAPIAYLPVEVDFPEMLLVSESTTNNASEYPTVKTGSNRVQVTAKKFAFHQMWSGEMEEDSIIPFIPYLRRQLAIALGHYSDSAVLNGDTTNAATGNINLDDADPPDTKHYLWADGIRHAALVDNTGNATDILNADVTLAQLSTAIGLMTDNTNLVDWGSPNDANDLVMIGNPAVVRKLALLDDVINAWMMNRAGQGGLLTGQAGVVLGHPLISSMAMPKTEADGKVSTTAANNTRNQIAIFNRRAFVIGWRRRVQIETERLPARDQTRIVASLRMGLGRFTPNAAASGIEAVSVLYNIAA